MFFHMDVLGSALLCRLAVDPVNRRPRGTRNKMRAKLTARSLAHRRPVLTGTTVVTIAGLLLAGCASQSPQEQRVATGATLGGATGALIGGLAGGTAGSAVAGGLAGAAVG